MVRRGAMLASLCLSLCVFALGGSAPAAAAPPDPVDDGAGRVWRQLYETTGVSWNQVAQVCPRDGATPCSGSIGTRVFTGWVWATDAQVVALLGKYAPAIMLATPPSVSGPEYYLPAGTFLGDMRWTTYASTTYSYSEWTGGWTASTDAGGSPIGGGVGTSFPPATGGLAVGTGGTATGVDAARGVWLWRPSSDDRTPPAITPALAGAVGSAGWYVSDVSVAWSVLDAESAISSRVGCEPATVTADTAGATFTCHATSAGGTASASASVKRDVTAPTVTCGSPAPVFEIYQIGARVPATVSDATSGPAAPTVYGAANTGAAGTFTTTVTGADRAGNRTSRPCGYQVVIPTCRGLRPTIVGTARNDVISGTSGPDVIVALGGADTVSGMGGDDVICGGDGPDTIDGGAGSDWIDGGASPDDLSGGDGDDTLEGGAGLDSLRGGNGRDTCTSGEARMSSCELIPGR